MKNLIGIHGGMKKKCNKKQNATGILIAKTPNSWACEQMDS